MSSSNLKVILNDLKSEKVTERSRALENLVTIFSRDSIIDNLDENGDGKAWLVVFQALFTTVLTEKNACFKKKTTPAALRRLGEAASAVRKLTERSVQKMNRKVVRALLAHLLQTMVHDGELLGQVALDYVKALNCLMCWKPHLDYLDDEAWVQMVEMSFNVVLGESLKKLIERGNDELDGELYSGDEVEVEEEEEDSELRGSVSPRKRRRRDSTPALTSARQTKNKPKYIHRSTPSVSLEQFEFMSLLAILLRSPNAPYLSYSKTLPHAIFSRLQRFLVIYPSDTSLHHNYLLGLSGLLFQLRFNRKGEVETFATSSWNRLVELWGTKNKTMKESLVFVLRMLFPFLTVDEKSDELNRWSEGVAKLWQLLGGEADSRWGIDGLSLDCLLLQVRRDDHVDLGDNHKTFSAQTFRAGWQFDENQALSWALLELQADCASKLLTASESIHSTTSLSRADGKRAKLENPITSLLHSVQSLDSPLVKAYHLQVLLFFIDRHWWGVHSHLQRDILQALVQLISSDDGVVQSWTFMCLAAIAHADSSRREAPQIIHPEDDVRDAKTWNPIWTHAVRRANVPSVCRLACHAAYVLLINASSLLTSSRVLDEIELLSKDIDVQGPNFPFDAVCNFLAECLRVAGQDARLYRMELENKVMRWLIDNWRAGEPQVGGLSAGFNRNKLAMAPHLPSDVLTLLASICPLSKRTHIICRTPLPDGVIRDMIEAENSMKVIRSFLLDAHLPPFLPSKRSPKKDADSLVLPKDDPENSRTIRSDRELVEPSGRERKLSAFFLKSLESSASRLETANDPTIPPAEEARRSLDLAVISLSFESLLLVNGTRTNRRVLQAACKTISLVAPFLLGSQWTDDEKALVLLGVEPLVFAGRDENEAPMEAMIPPCKETGIKSQVLKTLVSDVEIRRKVVQSLLTEFHQTLWQSADVQDGLATMMKPLRGMLRGILGKLSPNVDSLQRADIDEDGFGPETRAGENHQGVNNSSASRTIAEVCISFLAIPPTLQSISREAARDKELLDLFLGSNDEDLLLVDRFMLAAPFFFEQIRRNALHLNANNLDDCLVKFGQIFKMYNYARDQGTELLAIDFLDATLHLWVKPSILNTEAGSKIRQLCCQFSMQLRKKKMRSWTTRDAFLRLLDRYLALDSSQSVWALAIKEEEENGGDATNDDLPSALLPSLVADEDTRVRFRAATLCPRLFTIARMLKIKPLDLYGAVKAWLPTEISEYESMVTRMLTLGNIMVASSAVRRGPYWHLLETCIHSQHFQKHIEVILLGVSQRMGLPSFSVLFEAYASQIAYSIRQSDSDILRFPPHLLGYNDRRECAEATFRAFTPTNVLTGGPSASHGQRLFLSHCKAIQISTHQGIREAFGDIAGFQIVAWIDDFRDDEVGNSDELDKALRMNAMAAGEAGGANDLLGQKADGVVEAILRTLSDQDFSRNGPIIAALKDHDPTKKAAQAFQSLNRFRNVNEFETHEPNLPAFISRSVLRALDWFARRVSNFDSKAVAYHVLHELFADIRRSPLVNEQLRLVNAINLWIALYSTDFREPTLLQTLIQGATSLLSEPDLTRAAQSMLDWAFGRYSSESHRSRLPDVLFRVSSISHDYFCNTSDPSIATMGQELLQWLDQQAASLSVNSDLRDQVLRAIPVWSHQPSGDLAAISTGITSESLSSILDDHRLSLNKFRLVGRLRLLAKSGEYEYDRFPGLDFWRLKEAIPHPKNLRDEDVSAFADLLVLNKGHIDSFATEQLYQHTVRARHRRGGKLASDQSDRSIYPQQPIIMTLIGMLDRGTSEVYEAYRTLRLLMSVPNAELQFQTWPIEHQKELHYLQSYSWIPKSRPSRTITELSTEAFDESPQLFGKWISQITILLGDILAKTNPFYAQLTSILQSETEFAEDVFPVLVHTVLQAEGSQNPPQGAARSSLSNYFTKILKSESTCVSCLKSVVDVVLHLRSFSPPHRHDSLSYDRWLDIDFILLASKAVECGAYTTALLFLELAIEHQTFSYASDSPATEQILFKIYSHIDEPDGFYGIKTQDLRQFLIRRFHHEHQWEKAFRFHGASLEAGEQTGSHTEGLLLAFHSFGFNHLAIDSIRNSKSTAFDASSMGYRLGWRTETWDLPDGTGTEPGASLYHSLRAIYRERDQRIIDSTVRRALFGETDRLRLLGTENVAEIRDVTQNLMCLSQVHAWKDSLAKLKDSKNQDWSFFSEIDSEFDFPDLEMIMAARISLIRSIRQKEQRGQIGELSSPFAKALVKAEKDCLLRLSEAARNSGQVQVALNSVVRVQSLEKTEPTFEASQEFANVLWLQNEQKLAVQFLKDLNGPGLIGIKKAALLARLGAWVSEACLEKPTEVLTQFFSPATSIVDSLQLTEELRPSCAAVYHQSAIFAEHQYQAILKLPDAAKLRVYVDRKKEELRQRSDNLNSTQALAPSRKYEEQQIYRAKILFQEDQDKLRRHTTARSSFLRQAVEMYSRCLGVSDVFDDDSTIRLCSLWFSNFDDNEFQDKVRVALDRVPSRKFVFLAHQISARISQADGGRLPKNQENLQKLIIRMCKEHPFHSLYQVYCLRPESSSGLNRRQSIRLDSSTSQTDRGAAAGNIFERLKGDPTCAKRVKDVETVCDAALQWAKFPVKDDKKYHQKSGTLLKIPESLLIRKLNAIPVPVPTTNIPLDPTLRYDNCVCIDRYDSTFTTAGGINLPKINRCYGSDGETYKQLFKGEGNDDLRQDAVMEQVFDLVNIMLRRDRETKRRHLHVRGYQVIPLSSQAGLLEYVGNTLPMRDWLLVAHAKYYPEDVKHNQFMVNLKDAQKRFSGRPDKVLETFLALRKRFHPVMRHYFTEKHKTPMFWFKTRLNYTRSVSTMSIVGHVLGLGDRHTSNILMDNITGEVIHIDLGIAFDQGKLLTVPETVPFRMTADMVDGMGMSGTQGVFQRCAEETLRVLREDSEVILTVLEVFKHDPLHSWTASDLKIKRVQGDAPENAPAPPPQTGAIGGIGIDMSSNIADEAADRALTSVARKLDKSLSVEYTVNELIATATDPMNLAIIFTGWGPDL